MCPNSWSVLFGEGELGAKGKACLRSGGGEKSGKNNMNCNGHKLQAQAGKKS